MTGVQTCALPISLTLTGATAPVTFAWTGPNGFRSTGRNLTSLPAGTYSVVSTDANGCTATATATLVAPVPATPPTVAVIIAGPVPTRAQPNTIFLGYGPQTAVLSATGGVSYRWKPATNLSSASVANPVFAPTAAGTYVYTVVATNAAGCTASAVVKLIVVDVRCGNNPKNPKVLVCHNGHEICISPNAVPAHIGPGSRHDDYLGSCNPVSTNSVDALTQAATTEAVLDAFPNPIAAGTSTTVHFRTPAKTVATVRVYNQMGALVATLFDDVAESGRDYSLALNAAQWPAGIYLCHFVSKGETRTQRLVVSK